MNPSDSLDGSAHRKSSPTMDNKAHKNVGIHRCFKRNSNPIRNYTVFIFGSCKDAVNSSDYIASRMTKSNELEKILKQTTVA
jgi:hypothetical protein